MFELMGAPKGNKNAIGNKGGSSPLFKSPEDLQELIDSYFESCITDKTPITITGLIYHIGFASRQTFYDYEEKIEFADTIKRARLKVENHYEKLLQGTNSTGSIFALKNFGWKDKQEVEHSGEMTINDKEQARHKLATVLNKISVTEGDKEDSSTA